MIIYLLLLSGLIWQFPWFKNLEMLWLAIMFFELAVFQKIRWRPQRLKLQQLAQQNPKALSNNCLKIKYHIQAII
ncbi:hypothetical protein [Bombilactobacillus bombi]|uniref:hypothetical protein n=1 Tax=Bombilactobacillus bombi TaxID=1303590 RepID=UPI0015E62A57|nr:hypothetical protein [Bombilactobacillus bombi]MBA1433688.1 hypothetical protein [Bombilactobacillus bombi]